MLLALACLPFSLAASLKFLGCYIFNEYPAISLDNTWEMTPDICNDMMMGVYPYFTVSNASCRGMEVLWTNLTSRADILCPARRGVYSLTTALYTTTIQSTLGVTYRTGFFGADDTIVAGLPPTWSGGGGITGLYFNITADRLENIMVQSDNETLPDTSYKFNALEFITNLSLSFGDNPRRIDGLEFNTTRGKYFTTGNLTNLVNTLPPGVQGDFVLANLYATNLDGLRVAFMWLNKDVREQIAAAAESNCLSNATKRKIRANVVNASCEAQLALVLTENQEGFSWILIGLLAAALAVNVVLFATSKLYWRDKEAEYLTVLTATLGVVEYASEVMMIQSLSFDEEFALEFYVCLAALLASSVINVLGNVVILMLYGHFKPWLEAQRLHRVAFAVFAALCFLKGNILAVLASRLDHANTRLFQLPWSRRLQLRFRVLGLFVLCFSSLPQLVVIVLLHERLDEWTPLNALFVAVSICGCTIVAWRAFFELTFKDRGLDKDRNLEDNNKGDNDINDLPEPLRMQ